MVNPQSYHIQVTEVLLTLMNRRNQKGPELRTVTISLTSSSLFSRHKHSIRMCFSEKNWQKL